MATGCDLRVKKCAVQIEINRAFVNHKRAFIFVCLRRSVTRLSDKKEAYVVIRCWSSTTNNVNEQCKRNVENNFAAMQKFSGHLHAFNANTSDMSCKQNNALFTWGTLDANTVTQCGSCYQIRKACPASWLWTCGNVSSFWRCCCHSRRHLLLILFLSIRFLCQDKRDCHCWRMKLSMVNANRMELSAKQAIFLAMNNQQK